MHNIVVERLFLTPSQIEKGLMYDDAPLSAPDVTALFVFNPPRHVGMWMKNTPRALDIIFIRPDKTIAHIHKNARPFDMTTIRPPNPTLIGYVVEALAGYVDRFKLEKNDAIVFSSYITSTTVS
jgi:uncharacterized membrane protein (UPF0127 family)